MDIASCIDSLCCPITKEIYNEPVVASDGFIYEMDTLIEWFKINNISPKTGLKIDKLFLKCFDKKQQVNEFLLKYPEQVINQYKIKTIEISIEDIINNEENYEEILNNTNLEGLTINLNKIILGKFCDLLQIKSENLLKKIIDIIVDLEYSYYTEIKLIHLICKYSKPEIIKYIIDKGVDLECSTNIGTKPIHLICLYSTPEMIKYIIDKGVNLECCDNNGYKLIHYICECSTPEMIKYIIDKGVDLECSDNENSKPIHLICRYSIPKMIKYIIDKGVNLECCDDDNWAPIHLICRYSTPKMIKYIIDKGVNLECSENNGWNPIHFICRYSNLEIIQYIINIYVKRNLNITLCIKKYEDKKCEFNIIDLIKLNKLLSNEEKNFLISSLNKYFYKPSIISNISKYLTELLKFD